MNALARRPAFRLPVAPDDLVRHVLAAYYRAVGDATAPIGDPDPVSWSDPETFISNLCDFFELRVRDEAATAGHEVSADFERLRVWSSSPLCRDQHISQVDPDWNSGAGRSPADMGHGCPALALPAVGPAPVPCPSATGGAAVAGADITLHAGPLFCALTVQRLPERESVEILNDDGEESP